MQKMSREEAIKEIKKRIPCTDYLDPAPNHKDPRNGGDESGFCCPSCESGTHSGSKSTGAVKYYADTNTWHCHACGKGGDNIDAYQYKTGCDFIEATNALANMIEISIIDGNAPAKATGHPQSDFKRANDKQPDNGQKNSERGAQAPAADYTEYYKACRARIDDPAAVSYLSARGISRETVAAFGIGFDPAADPAKAPGAMGNECKKFPTPRVIIPCTKDFYIARSIDPNSPEAYKAINPSGSPVQLFNAGALYEPGAEIVFVVEGWADALSFFEMGELAIALNAKGHWKLLIEQLKRRASDAAFIVVPDNDDDPKTAADTMEKAQDLNNGLRAMGCRSVIYNVAGDSHDINDALKEDRATLRKNIDAAISYLQETCPDPLAAFFEKIQTAAYMPIKTGLPWFDDLLGGGMEPQTLTTLIAAPSTGKTALCGQIAEAMAEHRKKVIYINLEMSTEQMLARAFSSKAYRAGHKVTAKQVRRGYEWTPETRQIIKQVAEDYRRNNYPYIKYNPATVGADLDRILEFINSQGEAAKAAGEPAPAVILDYMHLVTNSRKLDLAETIKQILTGLKQYAIEYHTFCISISAANRDSMKEGVIGLYSARDSSNIEFSGDYVLTLNYRDIDRKEDDDGNAIDPKDPATLARLQRGNSYGAREMILRQVKGRDEGTGKKCELFYYAPFNTFEESPTAGLYNTNDYKLNPYNSAPEPDKRF